MSLDCPKCTKPLNKLGLEAELELDHCSNCKGYWLDQGELARSVGAEEDFPDLSLSMASDREVPFKCPRCEEIKLLRVPYHPQRSDLQHSLYVDTCPGCHGIWLDAKELGEIRQALREDRIVQRKSKIK
jgi:Zn-finger nucleic acid-binding protein